MIFKKLLKTTIYYLSSLTWFIYAKGNDIYASAVTTSGRLTSPFVPEKYKRLREENFFYVM